MGKKANSSPLPPLSPFRPYVLSDADVPPSVFPLGLDIQEDLLPMYNAFLAHLLEWSAAHGIIVYSGDPQNPDIGIVPDAVLGRVPMDILRRNPRTLSNEEDLQKFFAVLADTDTSQSMTDIIDLHTSVLTLYPETLTITLTNKVYRSLDAAPRLPHSRPWEDIHTDYPFLWLVIYIQMVVRRFAK